MRASDPRTREILERTEALTPEQLMRLPRHRPRPADAPVSGWDESRAARCRARSSWTASRCGRRQRACASARGPGGDVLDRALAGPHRGRRRHPPGPRRRHPARGASSTTTRAATWASGASPATASSSPPRRSSRWPASRRRGADPRRRDRQRLPGRRRLRRRGGPAARRPTCRAGVDVVDFGIRGMDLVYALGEGYDAAVLVDAMPRGEAPGTLYADRADLGRTRRPAALERARHGPGQGAGAGPAARRRCRERVLVVGCEPRVRMTGDEEEIVGELSAPVRAAIDPAAEMAGVGDLGPDGRRR